MKHLLALRDIKEVIESPDRDNIGLSETKISRNTLDAFKWLCKNISAEGKSCPKYLIYCRRIQDCFKLYRFFEDELGDKAYYVEGSNKR